jgi:hypothetical protein
VAVVETAGFPNLARVEVDQPGFQVRVRGEAVGSSSAYTEARDKIDAIKLDLHGIAPGSLSGRHYVGIWAEQDPFLLEYDMSNRPHLICNFRVMRSRT